ncbi:MAG TPA: outer membrane lipoprotein chaperone LolA [Blastocatellia bacterium]|nr:outer membrane lipoprotein chaperone LolA [Blastocatellia bacterium]
MKKFLFAISILLLLDAHQALAQTGNLDDLIKALQAKYLKVTTLSADFTQIYTSSNERPRTERGHLLLKKPGRMRWDYNTPEKKLFISNGRMIYEYVPSEKYVTRTPVKESDDLRAPFAFLLGRGNLRKEFDQIEYSKESPTKSYHKVLRMVPKRTNEFKELLVEIDPGTLQIARITVVDDDGSRSDFLFSNMRENIQINSAQFIFKPPAGVEVIDSD